MVSLSIIKINIYVRYENTSNQKMRYLRKRDNTQPFCAISEQNYMRQKMCGNTAETCWSKSKVEER